MRTFLAALVVLAACSADATLPRVRYANRAPVTRVDDRRAIAQPEPRPFPMNTYYLRQYASRPVDDALAVRDPHRARDVNALGEVPDSTWFVNRTPTPADIVRGPGNEGAPDATRPWTVRGTKVGGKTLGLTIKDARGIKYILKFDGAAYPEAETAADVIVQRLFWALGYHVPEDYIVSFTRDQLVLAGDAEVKDQFGNGRPMRAADLDAMFAQLAPGPDGRYRGLASRFLAGVPLGGWSPSGVREDDANDTVAHEDRRELRALYVFCAWLDHVDMKEDNALDMWVADKHYVVHYLVDFGKSLGVFGKANGFVAEGHAHRMEPRMSVISALTLGLWTRPWEDAARPELLGLGWFESAHFDPGAWRGLYPFEPFERMDRADAFWATKQLMKLTRAHVHAAVAQGQLSSAASARYLEDVLMARQRKIARHWFARMNPLDEFVVAGDGATLCFRDLWVAHALGARGEVSRYAAEAFDAAGRPLPAPGPAFVRAGGEVCVPDVPAGAGADGYTMVSLHTRRGRRDVDVPGTRVVHIARDERDTRRVVGVWRE